MSGTQKLGFCRTSRLAESSVLTMLVDEMIRIMDEFVEVIKLHQSNGEYQFDFAALFLFTTRIISAVIAPAHKPIIIINRPMAI